MYIDQSNKNKLNEYLEKITDLLDITQTQYEDAEARYKAVGKFLSDCPKISSFKPEIYPQGSFRLGTVVKPLLVGEEYDIDLVCQLDTSHETFSQKNLKHLVGNRLKEPMYSDKLQPENRRSWTLKYAKNTHFHLDILPAIPDVQSRNYYESLSLDTKFHNSAISITDNKKLNYNSLDRDWPKSNPKGYSEWFQQQMQNIYQELQKSYAILNEQKIDEVPFYRIKTPLQRAIQILKRHRDVMFGNDEDKPISIIITTLSAKAYSNQDNIQDALTRILSNMHRFIKKDVKGHDVIENPVDSRENFADKWVEFPRRRINFYKWLSKVKQDFNHLETQIDTPLFKKSIIESFGSVVSKKIFNPITKQSGIITPAIIERNKTISDYSPSEQFIQELYPVNLMYNLKMNCFVEQNGHRRELLKKLIFLKNRRKLTFFIEENNVPKPYKLKWKIRNRGSKAKRRGVRGTIINDRGNEERVEHSNFDGAHYVECYVLKDDVCVAMDRIEVPISGLID